jgi:hypothetical protein
LRLTIHDSTNANEWYSVIYDLQNGTIYDSLAKTVTVFDSKIEQMPNGYYRCVITADFGASATTVFYVQTSNGASISSGDDRGRGQYQGDGTSGLYIWGAQLESGSFSTSYIPNDGTTATVTRSADVCDGAGTAAEFNDSEGVLYAEIAALVDDGSYNLISLSDNTANNFIVIGYKDTNNTLFFDAIIGGTRFVSNPTTIVNQEEFNKICLKYKSGDTDIYFNGFKILSSATTFTHSGNSMFDLEFQYYNNTLPFYGKTKEIAYFKEALTENELEDLTSWDSFNDMAKEQLYTIE